jgi:hypothetical protein
MSDVWIRIRNPVTFDTLSLRQKQNLNGGFENRLRACS